MGHLARKGFNSSLALKISKSELFFFFLLLMCTHWVICFSVSLHNSVPASCVLETNCVLDISCHTDHPEICKRQTDSFVRTLPWFIPIFFICNIYQIYTDFTVFSLYMLFMFTRFALIYRLLFHSYWNCVLLLWKRLLMWHDFVNGS